MQEIEKKILNYLKLEPFGLSKSEKEKKFIEIVKLQIKHHVKNCKIYKTWYKKNNFNDPSEIKKYEDVPYLPSAIFKKINLKSTLKNNKIISSSGSTGLNKSIINIDKTTSNLQKICLAQVLSNSIGKKRKPFFIVDIEPTESFNQSTVSARYAGMSGYLMAATSRKYLLKINKDGKIIIDKKNIDNFLISLKKEPIILIGYTYMLWSYLLKNNEINLKNLPCHKDTKIIHFGGWKKLEHQKINKREFIFKLKKLININVNSILDIYGFSEQLGTIYISAGYSGCNVSSYSHVLIRDPKTLEVVKDGENGFMQFLSIIPLSYPGFSILNDDIGYISRRKINNNFEQIEFKVESRLDNLEARGCGDTLPNHYYI